MHGCGWCRFSFRRGLAFRIVGQDARSQALCELHRLRSPGELVLAKDSHSLGGGLSHGLRNLPGNPSDRGAVAAVGFARERHFACHVWNSHGDILRAQISNGLFSFLCFRRIRFVGP